ncbi:MAG: RsmE family RNA methyltransferase [Ferruginibacter sp.]
MAFPFFYKEDINLATNEVVLDDETSKHVAQVLRMQNGEQLKLTDGKGKLFIAEITDNNRRKCAVKILSSTFQHVSEKKITIAVSLVKNAHRFEWFLEKATEIGANEIVPLICTRTEKQHFRIDRMKGILVSAMLQSQQTWLPVLHEPLKFVTYLKSLKEETAAQKFIAHCEADEPRDELYTYKPFSEALVLIGPEGDFTIDEIDLALKSNFVPVALGKTRLRTETAGVVAVTTLSLG